MATEAEAPASARAPKTPKPHVGLTKRIGANARAIFDPNEDPHTKRVALAKTSSVLAGGTIASIAGIDGLVHLPVAVGSVIGAPVEAGAISAGSAVALGGLMLGVDYLMEEGYLPTGDKRFFVRTFHGTRNVGLMGAGTLAAAAAATEVIPHAAGAEHGLAIAAGTFAGIGVAGQLWQSAWGNRHRDALPQRRARSL